jgi:selenocysteine-specific elongation factor
VDHGKTALVHRLTGINPDRLKEEQERSMTIDLGFAWLGLPGGDEVGFIDVPGHRDFLENMLAGVGGVDAVLLVVAADEGVMPQTREHVTIVNLLGVVRGVAALTKTDLVSDGTWMGLVEEDVAGLLGRSPLQGVPIVRVSAITGEGMPRLLEALASQLLLLPPRMDRGRPRLSVDRSFTMAGFGTVVTGTARDGSFRVGDEVELLPGGRRGRIRGLQTHRRKLESSVPGSRLALNLSGVEVGQVQRGDWVTRPGTYAPTQRIDALLRIPAESKRAIQDPEEAKVFLGAAQSMARVRLQGRAEAGPGEEVWAQIDLERPLVCARGDRFLLRRPSPAETLAGGEVADPHPPRRYSRRHPADPRRMQGQLVGGAEAVLREVAGRLGIVSEENLIRASALARPEAELGVRHLVEAGDLVLLREEATPVPLMVLREVLQELLSRAADEIGRYHREFPLRFGIPRQELGSRLGLSAAVFPSLLAHLTGTGLAQIHGQSVAFPGRQPRPGSEDLGKLAEWQRAMRASPAMPTSWKEAQRDLGPELAAYILEQGLAVQLDPDVVWEPEVLRRFQDQLVEGLRARGSVTVAEARDLIGSTRKYTLALLEYLDRAGVTRREGDVRVLISRGDPGPQA